jgi:Family of unknown function (DUF6529)
MTTPGEVGQRSATVRLTGIGLLGLGVTAAIFAYGRLRAPNYYFSLLGPTPITLKSTLASVALGLAVVQVVLALWLYRKLPLAGRAPRPVGLTHRIVGVGLFAVTVPVALHCLIAYGVQFGTPRVAIHSIAGCFFYGAFAAKVLLVQSKRLPGWALPVAGGFLAILIGVLWYTSALWYYNGFHLPF